MHFWVHMLMGTIRPCYPEIPDTSWTGRRKTRKWKSKRSANNPTSRALSEPRTAGPVTRAMARRFQENNWNIENQKTNNVVMYCSMHGISSVSFLYHLIVFVQLEDKRHHQRGEL